MWALIEMALVERERLRRSVEVDAIRRRRHSMFERGALGGVALWRGHGATRPLVPQKGRAGPDRKSQREPCADSAMQVPRCLSRAAATKVEMK